ncbi:MAG TPA: hypothetical protein VFP54_05115 [Acidimicrobiales bacterium]|nr:hypothetical protein [Acidimicrobiales bacterium]
METFDVVIRSAVAAACADWSYPEPPNSWYDDLYARIPPGLCEIFARGLDSGLLRMTDGFRFTMRDLPPGKGPYALLSRSSKAKPGSAVADLIW